MSWRKVGAIMGPLLLVGTMLHGQTETQPLRLYMPDGQLRSHSVRVYVNRNVSVKDSPRLRLLEDHAVTKAAVDAATQWEPGVVAPDQEWTEQTADQAITRHGTLLMFDLSGKSIPRYKAMMRV